MKNLKVIITLSTLCVAGQVFGVSQQEKDVWKADINRMVTDNCINDKGQVDVNTMGQLMNYAGGIMAKQAQADAQMAQEWLASFFKSRLTEVRSKKGLGAVVLTEIPQDRINKWTEGIDKVIRDNLLNTKGTLEGRADVVALNRYIDGVCAVTEPEYTQASTTMYNIAKKKRAEIAASPK